MYKYAMASAACSALAVISGCGDSSAQALGNPVRGEQLATQRCMACHHPSGDSTDPSQPRIAGQNAAYLTEQLDLLRAGIRPSKVMNQIAAGLSDRDVADLAAFWSSARPSGSAWGGQDAARVAQGKQLFDQGNVGADLIACAVCHGDRGQGVAELVVPRIMGQAPGYLEKMLDEFARVPDFGDPKPNAMHIVIKRATPDDRQALVSYVSSQRWGGAR